MNEGREAGLAAVPSTNPDEVGWLTDADTSKLWNSAVELIRELGDERDWDDAYTKEEREDGIENLVTGLRPEMMEIGSLDEKGKRKIGGAGVPTEKIEGGLKEEQMFRFLSTGMLPQVPGSVQSYPGGR